MVQELGLAVKELMVGAEAAVVVWLAAQIEPFQVVPLAQIAVRYTEASGVTPFLN